MAESEIDEYKLDTNQGKKHHTFRVSLINNRVSLLMTNMDNPSEKHSNLVRLEQLRSACDAFEKTKTIKDALVLIKDTIENNRILISEDEEAGNIDIKFNIRIGKKNYSPFVIGLPLDEPEEEEENNETKVDDASKKNDDIEVLPTKFDYLGDLEAEAKYGKTMKNTTEYANPIIQSNVKEPNLVIEYIEPILQVHYPDGTTKSTKLPPRFQTADGKKPNINPEQLKSIHEQMTRSFNQSVTEYERENNRANSVSHKTSTYSRQTVNTSGNNTNNLLRQANKNNNLEFEKNNSVNNAVRSAMKPQTNLITFNNSLNNIRSTRTAFNPYDNERISEPSSKSMAPRDNYGNYRQNQYSIKGMSDYSTSSVPTKPLVIPNFNYGSIPNPTIKNNLNNSTNFNSNYNQYDQTQLIQEVPISQSQNIDFNMYQRGLNKSSSSPTMATLDRVNNNFYQQNQNYTQFAFQPNQTQSFLQNQINSVNGDLTYQYQQNQNQNNEQILQNNFNQTQTRNPNFTQNQHQYPHNNNKAFNHMQPQPQNNILTRHNSSQTPLVSQSFINQQNMQNMQNMQTMPNTQRMQQQNQQLQQRMKQDQKKLKKQKMNTSRGVQKKNNKNAQNRNLTQVSQEPMNNHSKQKQTQPTEKSKKPHIQEIQQKLKPSYSQQIIRQKPSLKNEITDQQIALAQMASLINIKNPNNFNVSTVSLNQRFLDKEGNEETQSQYEKEDEENEKNIQQRMEREQQQEQRQQQQQQNQETEINAANEADVFENLYRTETGLIIFRNGLLHGIIHKFAEITDVVSKIQIMLTAGVKFILLYRASDHGDKAKIFHQKCDNHQMTLVLVETTKGRRFGGFTTKSWDGNCVKKIDNEAFVFSLDKHKIYDVHKNEFAIGGYPKFGPVFFGCQIRIYDNFFTKGGTTCYKSLNYKTKEDYELNHGEQSYIVKEIEVYDIEVIRIT